MSIPSYLWNNNSGIEDCCEVAGREGSIKVLAFDHEVRLSLDPDTGDLTGTRIDTLSIIP